MAICVLNQYTVQISGGGVHANLGSYGKVTHVLVDGYIEAWVRENARRDRPAFLTSSGQRLSQKHRGVEGVQVLELAAPAEYWDHVAATIQHMLDSEGDPRPIVRSRNWTPKTAPKIVAARCL